MPARIIQAPPPPPPSSRSAATTPGAAPTKSLHPQTPKPRRTSPERQSAMMSDGDESTDNPNDTDADTDADVDMYMTPVAGALSLTYDEDDDDEENEAGVVANGHGAPNRSHALANGTGPSGSSDENTALENASMQASAHRVSFSRDVTYLGPGATTNGEVDGGVLSRRATDIDDGDESSDDEDHMYDHPVIHVEVRLRDDSYLLHSNIMRNVAALIRSHYPYLSSGFVVPQTIWGDVGVLGPEVERIYISEAGDGEHASVNVADADVRVHVYRNSLGGGMDLGADGIEDRDGDDDDDTTSPAMVYDLPSAGFDGLWDHLIYDDDIKPRLLKYISSSMLFSENEVDYNVISWNRMVLLHGPPGTGKTSLCRALAQKLAIRMSETFQTGKLVEINSHSLFSKWFSESGKLVHKLFEEVHAMIEDEQCLVVVMIDEVESLSSSREASNEPSDALRVVNALLTQLDKLKVHKNVLVMTTSNLAGKIDPAFLDRADVKQYVGLPPAEAIYWMLSSCLQELGRSGLATGASHLLSWSEASASEAETPSASRRTERGRLASLALMRLSQSCKDYGFSGRFLRKAPLMAHARYLGSAGARIDRWITALERAIADEHASRQILGITAEES